MKKFKHLLILVFLVFVAFGATYAATLNTSKISGSINVNSATVSDLLMVPYIDDAVAQNIVDAREVNGPFSSRDDLLKVKGVDSRLLDEIGPFIKLDGATTIRQNVK
jgi:DNA uptake protein ComE-like DNA-binding protein